jgi:HD-GYP domain-containing protein (c-di-GMP phosphodiesterase class II)
MAGVIVWGKTRGLLAGELPGASVREVETLAQLGAELAADGAAVVLADGGRIAADGEAFEAWLRSPERRPALVIAVAADAAEADALLGRLPLLDDALPRPLSAARLRHRLGRALDVRNDRRALDQLKGALDRKGQELHELNKIGVALSAERDIDKLLEMILRKSREITAADAGSLYLVELSKEKGRPDGLRFRLTQNDTIEVPFAEVTMPLTTSSMAGYVALTGQSINLKDAYDPPPESSFKSPRAFDERSGYRSKSMLVVPMRDHENAVIGVVQLINKKRDPKAVLRPLSLVDELVVPFTATDEELVSSLASQAAVAFENSSLIRDIRNLFDSLVRASVTAIEQRDPTTSGHSGRVAVLTVSLAEAVEAIDSGPFRDVRFDADQLQELRYASLLHDFGKVGVREKVLIKGKKLYIGEMMVIRQRFAYIKRALEADHLRALLEGPAAGRPAPAPEELAARQRELDELLRLVLQANEPAVLEEESARTLLHLTNRAYLDDEGRPQPFLTPNEVAALSIRRGSLSEKERREIESHVTHTFRFLREIPWTGEFRRIPEIAFAHHEKLDGSGYPRGLREDEIPLQSKMMTIADIFDALVAWDRPYKKSVGVERALAILEDEAKEGKLDPTLLAIFIEARIFERTMPGTDAGPRR